MKAVRERDHKQDQMSQFARERETLQERLVQLTRERDTALRVSENMRQAWEMHRVQSLERENYLQDQIEAGLVEIHRLNNLLHPIPRPIPVVGYFKRKQKNPQAHGYRCSFHPGVFQSIDFPQRT